ncbi:MAG: UDP-N-acetylmuramate--L-alanine ligase [Oligoflexia bacterium]|nr:UDP-N-acetylmuramate--L-alanine ligase [Oligoflexia bacterium]
MYNPALHFHFTGIGGSGMSGLAEILLGLGFRVSGSDLSLNQNCIRLQQLGAKIFKGHAASNLDSSTSLVVYSSAVPASNPELEEARERGLPLVRRAEVLAELMRLKYGVAVAGSHGKTTTTSMVAAILEAAKLDPTVIIGGLVHSIGSGGKLGKGDFLVAESDESDRSFLLLKPSIAVVTNIDTEHLGAYGSVADLEHAFEQFVSAVPFYGLAVLCVDDPRVRDLSMRYRGRKVSYGLSPDAQIRATNLAHNGPRSSFDLERDGHAALRVELPFPGRHLVQNSLAAIAVGLELSIDPATIVEALHHFGGVGRRLELAGSARGITVINDYGHHPTEIRATIEAVRSGWVSQAGRLHVVFQPHRFSRTRDCFSDFLGSFAGADSVRIAPIYPAGEAPIPGVDAEALCNALRVPENRAYLHDLNEAIPDLQSRARAGDVVLFLGAGSVGALPEQFLRELSHA